MRLFFFILIVLLFSCNTSPAKNSSPAPFTEEHKPAYSKRKYPLIDSAEISKIVLYVADTSIINPPEKINVFTAGIGTAPSLLDSLGKPCVKPSQTIQIKAAQKDTLIDILNKYL